MNAYLTTREIEQPIAVESLPDQPLFRGMTEAHRKIMAECSARATFCEGEAVVETGDPTDCFYLVVSGLIGLVTPGACADSPLRTISPGEILGWSWLFPPDCWQFDAIAIAPTEVILFQVTHLCQECSRDHGFGFELFKRMAQRRSRCRTNRLTKEEDSTRSIPSREQRGGASFSTVGSVAPDAIVFVTDKEKL
jgi:CRP-like cAMP-binding protein